MIGQTISHFRIVEKVGEGGMGVVYKAEDLRLRRPVALKFLSTAALSSLENRERFLQEAQAAAALSHPNIATVHEFIETDGMSFIAMEFVEGSTLEHLIAEGPLPLHRSTEYSVAVADALALAHRRGVIHRDIKPSNIMVFGEGEDPAGRGLKVLDFGVARIEGAPGFTVAGTPVGTLAYMSPEQAAGDPTDQRTDLFSLGMVFYEMVTGTPPFSADTTVGLLYQIVWEDPTPPHQLRPDVPPALEGIKS